MVGAGLEAGFPASEPGFEALIGGSVALGANVNLEVGGAGVAAALSSCPFVESTFGDGDAAQIGDEGNVPMPGPAPAPFFAGAFFFGANGFAGALRVAATCLNLLSSAAFWRSSWSC